MDENKIIELLAGYLQKTDRVLDRMDKHDGLFEKQFKRMDVAYQVVITHSEKTESLQQKTKEIQEEARELKKESLKRDAQNEALLKEILSISKRVEAIEGKN